MKTILYGALFLAVLVVMYVAGTVLAFAHAILEALT